MIKKFLVLFFVILKFSVAGMAQSVDQASSKVQSPVTIPLGAQIDYKFFLYGQTVSISITPQKTNEGILLNWIMKNTSGSYLISNEGLKDGTCINFVQPSPNKVLKLASNETFGIISSSAFKMLKSNKTFFYNMTNYTQSQDIQQLKIGDQIVNVIHVIGKEEPTEMWILDNGDLPLICQIKNNPLNINFVMVGFK